MLYLVLVLLVGEATSLYQLAKLPKLYGHFMEHKTRNPSVSFTEYLSMHYWGEDLNDHDDEKDMQLPFKKFDIHTPAFLFIPFDKAFAIKAHSWPISSNFDRERSQVYCNPELNALFKPPRV